MKAARLPDHAGDLRRRLADPRRLCELLGLLEGAKPQSTGLLIKCPWHADRTPSCSVRVAADGTIACRCFACDATGDALDLVAQVNGLSAAENFPKVLELAAELAGTSLADTPIAAPITVAPAPKREYPPASEVEAVWAAGRPVGDDLEVATWLRSRELDPAAIETLDLARALPPDATLPRWARTRLGSWTETGYRCLVPMFDERGLLRSVRARRVVTREDGGPKALPPAGHRMSGLIMACSLGRQLLALGRMPDFWPAGIELQIAVMEGEPDFLKWATAWGVDNLTAPATFGIVAGAWTPEIAARVPDGADVAILVHEDAAGDRYTQQIVQTLEGRMVIRRGPP